MTDEKIKFTCLNCKYEYKEYPCRQNDELYCRLNGLKHCVQCDYKFEQITCWECDVDGKICDKCLQMKDYPCKKCNALTITWCCCCNQHICIESTLLISSNLPNHVVKGYHENRTKYFTKQRTFNMFYIYGRLICGECSLYLPYVNYRNIKVELDTFKAVYKINYMLTIKRTLHNALAKYGMHDKLFIFHLANIISKL